MLLKGIKTTDEMKKKQILSDKEERGTMLVWMVFVELGGNKEIQSNKLW